MSATPLSTYVEARAAEMNGDEARSARLFAALAAANPSDSTIARRAISAAIQSGQNGLALDLARKIDPKQLPLDARLLLTADALRRGKTGEAITTMERGDTSTETDLFGPLLRAWDHTARGRMDGVTALATQGVQGPLGSIADEHRAAMLFALRRPDEALPIAQKVVARGGGRSSRLRVAYADALIRAKRVEQAQAMLAGSDATLIAARNRLIARRPLNAAIDTPSKGFAELLVALAVDISRDESKSLPIALVQVARHASPDNYEPTLLLALLLDGDSRPDDALGALWTIPADALLAGDALDLEAKLLSDTKRRDEALRRAHAAAQSKQATSADYRRLGNVLGEMERHSEAASAYAQAIQRSGAEGQSDDLWTLHLLRAASLEQAGNWSEAKAALETAMRIEPDNAVLLNFLGYGKLERGEDLDAAEAMIRKASALRPNDASITDSLGWALYKRGRLPEAVETLTRAAAGDPTQGEIHEHLGDALFASGRRIEARFSWEAALLVSEDKAKARLRQKIASGLDRATAAP
ncbi:tetratricopeptide repeat protein [Sphingomonas sp. LY29]|uniref:tetratricopeptide repeat protein n=1 Tax=Sphingomonas sp. LY29 TaxID=3095341 RepID=UPI002D777FD6|nr:tetratricopeptide repeat protein [Sphingomonas sp. LY29]WRP26098.1 tetratricopeptide repeat protein [Sphingomonas sp. LY29]